MDELDQFLDGDNIPLNNAVQSGQSPQEALPPELPEVDELDAFLSSPAETTQPIAPVDELDTFLAEPSTAESSTSSKPVEKEFNASDYGRGLVHSFEKTALGVAQAPLYILDPKSITQEDFKEAPRTSTYKAILGAGLDMFSRDKLGVSAEELKQGSADVAQAQKAKEQQMKDEGRYGFAAGNISGDILKTAAILPANKSYKAIAAAGAKAGALLSATNPVEESNLTPEQYEDTKLTETLKGATIGAIAGAGGKAALSNKYTAIPAIGGLGMGLRSEVLGEDPLSGATIGVAGGAAVSAAIGLTLFGKGKVPNSVKEATAELSSKALNQIKEADKKIFEKLGWEARPKTEFEVSLDAPRVEDDLAALITNTPKTSTLPAVSNAPKIGGLETQASQSPFNIKSTPKIVNNPFADAKRLSEIDQIDPDAMLGPLFYYTNFIKDGVAYSAENIYRLGVFKLNHFQNISKSLNPGTIFKVRQDDPFTSRIAASLNQSMGIKAHAVEFGFPNYYAGRHKFGDLLKQYSPEEQTAILSNLAKNNTKVTADTIVEDIYLPKPNAVAAPQLIEAMTKNGGKVKDGLQYLQDKRTLEDAQRIFTFESRNNIFFEAVDDQGKVLGKYLSEGEAAKAWPGSEIMERTGEHHIKIGRNGETLGVFGTRKEAEQGSRVGIYGDEKAIRARVAAVENTPGARAARTAWKSMQEDGIRYLRESGNISREEAERVLRSYDDYFPGFRERYLEESGQLRPKGLSAKKGIAAAKGGEDTLLSPEHQIMVWQNNILDAGNRNRTLNRMFELFEAKAKQDPTWWDKSFHTSYEDYVKQVTGAKKVNTKSNPAFQKAMEGAEDDPIADSLLVGKADDSWDEGRNITFLKDGNRVDLRIKDPLLIKSIASLNMSVSPYTAPLRVFRELERWNVTSTPAFALRAMMMDQFSIPLQSQTGLLPLQNTVQGLSLLANRRLREIYNINTGSGSTMGELSQARNAKAVEAVFKKMTGEANVVSKGLNRAIEFLKGTKRLYEAPSNLAENAPRTAEFWNTIGQGKTGSQAAVASEEVTVPFKTHGADNTLRNMNAMASFFNAGLQGMDRFFRAARYFPEKTAMYATTYVTVPGVAIQQATIESIGMDNFYRIPETIRRGNFLIPISGDIGKNLPESIRYQVPNGPYLLKIPHDRTITKIFLEPMLAIMDDINQNTGGVQFGNQLVKSLQSTVSIPSLFPTAFDLGLEMVTKKDWQGNPHVPDSVARAAEGDKSLEYTESTSTTGRVLSDYMGNKLSPIEVDIVGKGLIAGHYDMVTKFLVDPVLREQLGMVEKADTPFYEMPQIKSFIQHGGYDNTQKVYRMLESMSVQKTAYTTHLHNLTSDSDFNRIKAQKFMEENPLLIEFFEKIQPAAEAMADTVKERNVIDKSGELDGKQKEIERRKLLERREIIAKNFLEDLANSPRLKEFYAEVYYGGGTHPFLDWIPDVTGSKGADATRPAARLGMKGGDYLKQMFSKDAKETNLPPVTLPNSTKPSTEKAPTLDFFNSQSK